MIRKYKESDLKEVERIWRTHYNGEFKLNLPGLEAAIIEKEGIVTGFGFVNPIVEIIMLLDKSQGVMSNGKDFLQLMGTAKSVAKLWNFDQLHAFVQDSNFSDILKGHFGFKNTKGESLVINI